MKKLPEPSLTVLENEASEGHKLSFFPLHCLADINLIYPAW